MGAVEFVFRSELRRRWRSWLALAGLIALVGGLVLDATATGRRTASAFPRFVARHGYDAVVYNTGPVPALARLPEVASLVLGRALANGTPVCACTRKITAANFSVLELSPRDLGRTVKVVEGVMPDQSKPDEVLASFTLEQDDGVHVGSVIRVPIYASNQEAQAFNGGGTPRGPMLSLRVVGIEAAESEFPSGQSPSYDVYGTQALGRAVLSRSTVFDIYFARLRHGERDIPRFSRDVASLHALGSNSEAAASASVAASIRPQAIGWWVLAALAGLAGLVVIGQALGRQNVVDSEEYPTLATLGLLPRQLAWLGMVRNVAVGVVGALGAVAVAVALSPLTPVGEARLAEPSTGIAFDPLVFLLGALAIVIVVVAVGMWPALRASRSQFAARRESQSRPSSIVTAIGAAGAPPSAVIGVRHALVRGRGKTTVPVGTALFGTVLAVMALCATAVFGASLTRLTVTPALYGDAFQLEITGISPGDSKVLATLLATLQHDKAVNRITLGTSQQVSVNGRTVDLLAGQGIRGPVLLSMVRGSFPRGDGEIALGATTMRQVGVQIGSTVVLSVQQPAGGTHSERIRVVSQVSIPSDVGSGGLGTGAAMALSGYMDAICPKVPARPGCLENASQNITYAVLAGTVPGNKGDAAIAHYLSAYKGFNATRPITPTSLVNFGEAVNFPLILGVVLAIFGGATLVHLLVVSVVRRRREVGLLKALGFVNPQVIAAVGWQATTVALVGIVIGVPLGVAVGQVAWRTFATNLGAVPEASVPAWLIGTVAGGVLVVANVLAVVPALAATTRRAADLLRTQ